MEAVVLASVSLEFVGPKQVAIEDRVIVLTYFCREFIVEGDGLETSVSIHVHVPMILKGCHSIRSQIWTIFMELKKDLFSNMVA